MAEATSTPIASNTEPEGDVWTDTATEQLVKEALEPEADVARLDLFTAAKREAKAEGATFEVAANPISASTVQGWPKFGRNGPNLAQSGPTSGNTAQFGSKRGPRSGRNRHPLGRSLPRSGPSQPSSAEMVSTWVKPVESWCQHRRELGQRPPSFGNTPNNLGRAQASFAGAEAKLGWNRRACGGGQP